MVQVDDSLESEESEQLQEPLDQISTSSTDSVKPDEYYETKSVVVWIAEVGSVLSWLYLRSEQPISSLSILKTAYRLVKYTNHIIM